MLTRYLIRFGSLAALCILGIAAQPALAQTAGSFSEYDVKAALLYNATKFIRWPAPADAPRNRQMQICVIGSEPAFKAMRALNGKKIHNASISVVRQQSNAPELKLCDIAYFSDVATAKNRTSLLALDSLPVLTVGQTDAFAEHGGVMSLVLSNNRVNFVINASAADKSQLEINAQLLEVARVIRPVTSAKNP